VTGGTEPDAGTPDGIGGRQGTGACAAPAGQLYVRPDGDVRVCVLNERSLGNIEQVRLLDLWRGDRRAQMLEALRQHDYSIGCTTCRNEIAAEGRTGSYAENFDWLSPDGIVGGVPEWPVVLHLNLSISCNLQCIQCNGTQSSSIRIHRERRPALEVPFTDEFFDDLGEFMSHADLVRFSGGEPFLGAEFFRAFDLLAEVAPATECIVITNATQWNDRVVGAINSLKMGFVLSIDAATKETYESIRVGASFDEVMVNAVRLREHARAAGTHCSVNFCLMAQNAHEFPQLLQWAESLDLHVDVSVVREPPHCSIASLPQKRTQEIYELLRDHDVEMESTLRLNLTTWRDELERIRTWATCPPEELVHLIGISEHMVLGFKCEGDGPHDDTEARLTLEAFAPGRPVVRVTVDRFQHIASVSPEVSEVFELRPEELLGQPAQKFRELLEARHGTFEQYRVVSESSDRSDASFTIGGRDAWLVLVAQRDERGWADTGDILICTR